jgi:hypothetical protein
MIWLTVFFYFHSHSSYYGRINIWLMGVILTDLAADSRGKIKLIVVRVTYMAGIMTEVRFD